jgi:hypothetical protein
MKVRPFIAVVMDAEGITHDYVFKASDARHAEREARECLAQSERATTLVGITPMADDRRRGRSRRLLALGTFVFVVSGATIAAMLIIGLSLEGAL